VGPFWVNQKKRGQLPQQIYKANECTEALYFGRKNFSTFLQSQTVPIEMPGATTPLHTGEHESVVVSDYTGALTSVAQCRTVVVKGWPDAPPNQYYRPMPLPLTSVGLATASAKQKRTHSRTHAHTHFPSTMNSNDIFFVHAEGCSLRKTTTSLNGDCVHAERHIHYGIPLSPCRC